MSAASSPPSMRQLVYGSNEEDSVEFVLQWTLREFEEARLENHSNQAKERERLEESKKAAQDLAAEGDRITREIAKLVAAIDLHRTST